MPSVIYNISLWRATTVKHRRVDTSLPWSAETRQNDKEKERGPRPLRARINLLSSRPSCCCGLDATHKGGKEEEEGFFVVGPFSFFLSFFLPCATQLFGGDVDGVRRDTKSRGLYFCSSSLLDFSRRIKTELKNPFDRISIWFVGRQWDEIRWRWIPFLRNVFNYKPSGFFLPSFFLFFFIPDQLIIW